MSARGGGKSSVGGVGAHAGSLRPKVEQSACALVVHILVFPFKLKNQTKKPKSNLSVFYSEINRLAVVS
jgi:hypothetical protein